MSRPKEHGPEKLGLPRLGFDGLGLPSRAEHNTKIPRDIINEESIHNVPKIMDRNGVFIMQRNYG